MEAEKINFQTKPQSQHVAITSHPTLTFSEKAPRSEYENISWKTNKYPMGPSSPCVSNLIIFSSLISLFPLFSTVGISQISHPTLSGMGCLSNPEDRRNFEPIMIATDRPQNTSHFIRQAVGKHEHEFRCVCVCGLCYWVLFPLTPHLKFIERQPEFRQNETQKGFSFPMASATRVDVKGLPPTHTHTWMGRRSVV